MALVLGLAYGSKLWQLGIRLWEMPHYQYFPFAIIAFVYLLRQRSSQATPLEGDSRNRSSWASNALIITAWILLVASYWAYNPWLSGISAIVLVAGIFVRLSRRLHIVNLWGIWLILWLAMPLPLGFDSRLINVLQRWSSRLSSIILDWFGVQHLMEGNALFFSDKQLFVDETCSGIVSVMSVVACAVIYSVWRNRPPIHLVLLTITGIGWATMMNVVRISVIALAYHQWGVDWSGGAPHEILGLVVFSFTFSALVGTDYLLIAILAPIARTWLQQYGEPITYGKRVVTFGDWLVKWGNPSPSGNEDVSKTRASARAFLKSPITLGPLFLLAFGTLGAYGAFLMPSSPEPWWNAQLSAQVASSLQQAKQIHADILPQKVGSLTHSGFKFEQRDPASHLGHYSGVYKYTSEGRDTFIVSCDFLFGPTWHELDACYLGTGWQLVDQHVVEDKSKTNENGWSHIEGRYAKPDGTNAILVYCNFDELGQPVAPRIGSIPDKMLRLMQRSYRVARSKRHFQIQVWMASAGQISEEERILARDLLLEARERLRKFIIPSGGETVKEHQGAIQE